MYNFSPKLIIPINKEIGVANYNDATISSLVFHIGLVELISYWKSTCSPKVYIECGFLNTEQIYWFKKLYFHVFWN